MPDPWTTYQRALREARVAFDRDTGEALRRYTSALESARDRYQIGIAEQVRQAGIEARRDRARKVEP